MTQEPGPLVSAEWLHAHLEDPQIRVVHVSPDREVYDVWHLPRAVFGDLHSELARPGLAAETGAVEREWLVPAREDVAAALDHWGVGPDSRVVFYDDVGQNRQAIRGYWLLRLHGFPPERVHVLDGGLPLWEADGRPLTAEVVGPGRAAGAPPLSGPDPALIATAEQVLAWSGEAAAPDGPTRIVDVRTIDEYLGVDVRALRGGHIPGARQRLWSDLLAPDGRMRPPAQAVEALRAGGVDPAEVRAVYCQGGVRAALVWFVLHELAGYPEVRSYAGSWEEWGNRPDLPVEL